MHPEDEQALAAELLRDPSIRFVDGPRWKQARPIPSRELSEVGHYCIVWSVDDLPKLAADFIPSCNDWYCRSEHSTIQFLRSSLEGNVLTDGRFSVSTEGAKAAAAESIERRFKAVRRFLKKSYLSSVVQWANVNVPFAPATASRSANPSKPDSSFWVGPSAAKWLREDSVRCIQTTPGAPVQGKLKPFE